MTSPRSRQDADHPITPPPELIKQWLTEGHHQDYCSATEHAITQAARWGADQELEACCEWASRWVPRWPDGTRIEDELRAFRREEPPSLKEQALAALEKQFAKEFMESDERDIIRRALESLPS